MVIVIVGPTGVGKTKLSIELAKRYDGEVINGDSMQIYRGLDIGTAKIKEEEKDNIEHHLFDIVDVDMNYTVYDYQKDGRDILDNMINKTPIIVGGSGLYIKALLYNYDFKEESIKNDYDDKDTKELYDMLYKIDPNTNIHPNNRKRIIRALNKSANNSVNTNMGNELLYDAIFIGLTTNRNNLYNIINNRVDIMFEEGLVEEVKHYYDLGIRSKAIMTGIGYKELYQYFDGIISLKEAKELIKKNSRHYAKRQYTFFNNQLPIKWFDVNYEDFDKTVLEVIEYIKNRKS